MARKSLPVILGAIALIVIGLLVVVPAGLCTSIMYGLYQSSPPSPENQKGFVEFLGIVVPLFVFGSGLTGLGLWLLLRK